MLSQPGLKSATSLIRPNSSGQLPSTARAEPWAEKTTRSINPRPTWRIFLPPDPANRHQAHGLCLPPSLPAFLTTNSQESLQLLSLPVSSSLFLKTRKHCKPWCPERKPHKLTGITRFCVTCHTFLGIRASQSTLPVQTMRPVTLFWEEASPMISSISVLSLGKVTSDPKA